jgi:dynamin 1-like protein
MVFEELRTIVLEIEMPELVRFHELRRKINEEMMQLLVDCLKPTNQMVRNLLIVQDSYINTFNPDFRRNAAGLIDDILKEKGDKDEDSEEEKMEEKDFTREFGREEERSRPMAEDRVRDFHGYEITKYLQNNTKSVKMPKMMSFKRASNDDPGQSKKRGDTETLIIKKLILRYFDTVKKTMNDVVPKTIMAFLVNKAKN